MLRRLASRKAAWCARLLRARKQLPGEKEAGEDAWRSGIFDAREAGSHFRNQHSMKKI
jgi:hypothetical protein